MLQTDLDGLIRLKQSALKARPERIDKKQQSCQNLSEFSISTSSDRIDSEIISNFSFDACEISELRITSV